MDFLRQSCGPDSKEKFQSMNGRILFLNMLHEFLTMHHHTGFILSKVMLRFVGASVPGCI